MGYGAGRYLAIIINSFHLVPGAGLFDLLCPLLPLGVNDTEVRVYLPILLLRNFLNECMMIK